MKYGNQAEIRHYQVFQTLQNLEEFLSTSGRYMGTIDAYYDENRDQNISTCYEEYYLLKYNAV
jgi:hypothetical protein